MNTKRTTLYLVALLVCGASLGTLLTVNILGKPFEYAWVTVTRHAPETTDTTDVNDVEVPEATWKEYSVRTSGVTVAYPAGWSVLYDSALARTTSDTRGDILYLSPNPLDNTPRGGAMAPVLYEFVRNGTAASLTAAVNQFAAQMTNTTTTTVTYNTIEWTKVIGTEDFFGTPVAGEAYFALVAGSSSSTLVRAEFAYSSEDDASLKTYLNESVSRAKLSE